MASLIPFSGKTASDQYRAQNEVNGHDLVKTTSDNTNGTYFIPFVKTGSTGGKGLFIDDVSGPLTYNPSTAFLKTTDIECTVFRETPIAGIPGAITSNTLTISSNSISDNSSNQWFRVEIAGPVTINNIQFQVSPRLWGKQTILFFNTATGAGNNIVIPTNFTSNLGIKLGFNSNITINPQQGILLTVQKIRIGGPAEFNYFTFTTIF